MNHNTYCLPQILLLSIIDEIKALPDINADIRNVFGQAVMTAKITIAISNHVVTRYLVQLHGNHGVIRLYPVCQHNPDVIPMSLVMSLLTINKKITDNKVGEIYFYESKDVGRVDNVLELVDFFREHSNVNRDSLNKNGHITVNLCDKISPMLIVSKLVYDEPYVVWFELPTDVRKIMTEHYEVNLDYRRQVLIESATEYKQKRICNEHAN